MLSFTLSFLKYHLKLLYIELQFYIKYGNDLMEMIEPLSGLEYPILFLYGFFLVSATISGFGLFSAFLKFKSITASFGPSLFYFFFAVNLFLNENF